MNVAVFTPLPPSSSGIAQYSAELLPYLAPDYNLTVVIADNAPAPAPLPFPVTILRASTFAPRRTQYDAIIYQLGNSPEHAYILAEAETFPGITVLHDVVLQHLQLWRALHGDPAPYRAAMAARYGAVGSAAAEALLHNRLPAVPYQELPLCEQVVERSLLTIVHSAYARDLVQQRCPAAPLMVVPHGVPLHPLGDRALARQQLGLPERALIVAALGNLIPEKRLEVALRAFARALFGLPDALFVVAGSASAHYQPANFAQRHGLAPVTRWLSKVDATTFEALLVAANLCVNLRWPTGGETSGSLLRMLAAGRATLISTVGAFNEIPDNACLKVPIDDTEEAVIVRAILRAAHEPEWLATIGAHARAFAAEQHSFARAAAGYRLAIASLGGAA